MTGVAADLSLAGEVAGGSLQTCLILAVPLWLSVLRDHSPAELAIVIDESARVLADGAPQPCGEPAAAAKVITHLARLIAAAAFGRGGVTFAGMHWCDPGPEHGEVAAQAAPAPLGMTAAPAGPVAGAAPGRPRA